MSKRDRACKRSYTNCLISTPNVDSTSNVQAITLQGRVYKDRILECNHLLACMCRILWLKGYSTSDHKAKGGEMNFEAHFCSLCVVDDSTAYDYCLADTCQMEEDEVYAHTLF